MKALLLDVSEPRLWTLAAFVERMHAAEVFSVLSTLLIARGRVCEEFVLTFPFLHQRPQLQTDRSHRARNGRRKKRLGFSKQLFLEKIKSAWAV